MKVLLIVLGVILLLLLICVIRTLAAGKKEAIYTPSDDEERIEEYAKKLQKMIQYETVSVRGVDQAEKFRGFHKVLEELFPTVFEKLEKIEIDGNLMMKWKGSDPSLDPIIMISHQDVVEATGDWKYPPFSGEIVDGKMYGRGTGDIKCGVMTFYQAAEELLKAGYTPKCDVYLGSSCTEEIGGDGAPKMVQWLKDHGVHLFMLCDEGGCIIENPVGGVKGSFAAIGIFEKGYGDLKFSAKGNGGHSSTPKKNTPIARLAKFEAEVEKKSPFKAQFSPAVIRLFESVAPYSESFGFKLVMTNLWLLKPILTKIMGMISAEADAMLKTTVCFTMQKGSEGYNVIPQDAWVTANLRYIPHQKMDESNEIMRKIAAKYDIEMEKVIGNDPSRPLDLNGKPYEITVNAVKKIFPELGIMPYVVTGGTDSRFFDSVCDSCVRFTPVKISSEQMKGMHGLNENIDINVLPPAVDYFKEIIKAQEER
ncbi:MAG: M20/M25/M40 family metallo-hydrolase [Clostridia bacterium]|nr:M20/M25/M40 family metallo-hydrolase [Clostridia bacterium]